MSGNIEPLQSVGKLHTSIALYCIDGFSILYCLYNLFLCVVNLSDGAARQRTYNILLLLVSFVVLLAPSCGLVMTFAMLGDGVEKHSVWLSQVEVPMDSVEDERWYTTIEIIKIILSSIYIKSVTFIAVMFYFNFRNIRAIRPFSAFWDYIILGICLILTILVHVFLFFYRDFKVLLSFIFIDGGWNALIISFFSWYFLKLIFIHAQRKLAARRIESSIAKSESIADRRKMKDLIEMRVHRILFKSVNILVVAFWIAVGIMGTALYLNFQPNHINLSAILLRLAFVFLPIMMHYSVTFVINVRRFLRAISRNYPAPTTTTTDLTKSEKSIPGFPSYFPWSFDSKKSRNNSSGALHSFIQVDSDETQILGSNATSKSNDEEVLPVSESNLSSTATDIDTSSTLIKDDFHPLNQDEVSLTAGDQVRVIIICDDGWAFGENIRSKKYGFFPLSVCVDEQKFLLFPPLKISLSHLSSPIPSRIASFTKLPIVQPLTKDSSTEELNTVSSIPNLESKPGSELLIIREYTHVFADELDLVPGDRITLVAVYNDGWAFGIHNGNGSAGVFPSSFSIILN